MARRGLRLRGKGIQNFSRRIRIRLGKCVPEEFANVQIHLIYRISDDKQGRGDDGFSAIGSHFCSEADGNGDHFAWGLLCRSVVVLLVALEGRGDERGAYKVRNI